MPDPSDNCLKYRNKNPLQRFFINNFLIALDQFFKKTGSKHVLDAGCGEGFVSSFLLNKNPNIQFVGLDNSKDSLAIFKTKVPKAKTVLADINNMPFEDNAFDLVLANEVLEHLPNPSKALMEVKRVTRKFALFSVPHEPFFRTANMVCGKNIKNFGSSPGHIQHWNKDNFQKLIQKYFKITSITTSFPWIIILGEK